MLKESLLYFYRSPLERPRGSLVVTALIPLLLLSFGLYLQHVVGLEPCPMCIVQRYVLILITLVAALGSSRKGLISHLVSWAGVLVLAITGAYVAARQSWLQWYPPEEVSCGRDFYGMIETFPLKRAIPMIFKGGGDCSNVDWTLLGGSIANWSFVAFAGFAIASVVALKLMLSKRQRETPNE